MAGQRGKTQGGAAGLSRAISIRIVQRQTFAMAGIDPAMTNHERHEFSPLLHRAY